MCTHSAAIWLLAVVWCAGLTASTAHSAVSLPSSQQQRSLLKTSPAANATSCLERAKQFLQALERNVTEPAVSPCGPTERAAQAAAALADDSAKAAKCQSDQTKALMAGRNVTVECPDRKQPAKEDIDTLGSRARDLMNEAWDKYDKAAAAKDPFNEVRKEVQRTTEEAKMAYERSQKDMQRANAKSSASSPHVNVGKIVLFAIAGLAVLV